MFNESVTAPSIKLAPPTNPVPPPSPQRRVYRVPDQQFKALLHRGLRLTRRNHLISCIRPIIISIIWFLLNTMFIFNVPTTGIDIFPTSTVGIPAIGYIGFGTGLWLLWWYVLVPPLRMDLQIAWNLRQIQKSLVWQAVHAEADQIVWVYPRRVQNVMYRVPTTTSISVYFQMRDYRYFYIRVSDLDSALILTQAIGERSPNAKVGFNSL